MDLLAEISTLLAARNSTLSSLVLSVLTCSSGSVVEPVILDDLLSRSPEILNAFHQFAGPRNWTVQGQIKNYTRELQCLVRKENGWHFSALHASAAQITDFELDCITSQMQGIAPGLWSLLDALTTTTEGLKKRLREEESTTDEEEDNYWRELDGLEFASLKGPPVDGSRPRASRNVIEKRQNAIHKIRKVIILSIMMLTANQKCNAFASVIGIFCHANNTPEKVVEVLARLGISVSIYAVQDAIKSLSREADNTIRKLGQTLTTAYAYDNFDIDLKTAIPTVEKGTESSLKHLTSGLLFALPKGTTKEDLRCSDLLWRSSRLNDTLPDDRQGLAPDADWKNLYRIHPQYQGVDARGMSVHDRWSAWKILSDLIEHGPEEFRQFWSFLNTPEAIEQIPLEKTRIIPARAMNINNSTVSGNLEAIANLMSQGGVGDPMHVDDETLESLIDYVVIVHGDLGSGERITHAQIRRAIERSPYHRYQFVVFALGLFHLKMACADAIWRILIRDHAAQQDETSVMRHLSILRPRETGKYASNPGFRRMHQLILHDGTCRRLNCWRELALRKNSQHTSLEEFAKSKPTFPMLQAMANELVLSYVASSNNIHDLRSRPKEARDQQYENNLLINQYYLLYEELSYAMNKGDIGRVELLFAPWVPIFKATGKHKYATKLTAHITLVHFVFPSGLKRAVRYSMLINPKGKPDHFRAVDWAVELNNLYTKHDNVVAGPNRTADNIIKESVLLDVFRQCHLTLEKNLVLNHLTTHHTDPDMTETFAALLRYMELEEARPYKYIKGRNSRHKISDMIEQGMASLLKGAAPGAATEQEDPAGNTEESVDLEDVSLDLIL